jgi:hypothetical protein
LKTLNVVAFALNAALYVSVGILFYSALPLSFGQVRFWPQVIVPAVFAVVFGPWVGGLGAALGIFVNDLVLNNNPVLSLMAGVTANFAAFWLIGYIANKKPQWKISVTAYGLVTALLIWIAYVYTDFVYVTIVAASYAIFLVAVFSIRNSKWQSYEIGSVIGLLVGSAIIGLMVPVYLQFFAPSATALTVTSVFAYFIWTFTTEIPFLIILGPPIIWAVYRAFPRFRLKKDQVNRNEDR